MKKIKIKSIRTKLFLALCATVVLIIILLILLNNFVLIYFYEYNKKKNLGNVYNTINEYYKNGSFKDNLNQELDKIAINNNFDILIRDNKNDSIYTSSKDFYSMISDMILTIMHNRKDDFILEEDRNYAIIKLKDSRTNINYMMLTANLDNLYSLYIRMPMTSIEESVKISNEFLYIIAIFVIIIGGIIVSIVSKRFSDPIIELNEITKNISNLNFEHRYKKTKANNEIDNLGESINILSEKLEKTIQQLRNNNMELEKDIEQKSKIDEMRKSFISDVSHELKTPIALIQGYGEGLIENVNTDDESRRFYAEVILDEANKMDKLVKQLLELMKLEYGKMEFNNKVFNLSDLENEIIKKSKLIIDKKNIILENNIQEEIYVFADEFYIEQILTNYLTNAIKYSTLINGEKHIRIENEILKDSNKVRIKVFNTYKQFSEEDIMKIWNRFYKIDESRNRENGGTGLGLSLVKAIMNNYGNNYGVKNVAGGVEFFFELDLDNKKR